MKRYLKSIADGGTLSSSEAEEAILTVMRGEATPAEIAGFLMGLRSRGETIDEFFSTVLATFPEREALVSVPQRLRWTYERLDREVSRAAKALIASGIENGDRVGIWSTDNAEWVAMQLATARIGAILVNINPAYRTDELAHALSKTRLRSLVMIPRFKSSNYVGMIRELCPQLDKERAGALAPRGFPDLRSVVLFDPADSSETERPAPGFTVWSDFLKRGEGVPESELAARRLAIDPDDPVNIQFTSGTTGRPKAATLTHHNVLNNAYFLGDAMRFSEEDRLCVPVPFYHCFGMVVSNLVCLTRGACIVIPSPHFDSEAVLQTVQNERCTALHGVPTMFVAELERDDFSSFDLSSLRTGIMAGAPCPPELVRRVIDDMGLREILIAYGMTESSPVTHVTSREDTFEHRVETVGTNLPHQEVKVTSPESGETAPVGSPGEVCFRGYHVMKGYWDDEEATRQVIDDSGWLHSGDIGIIDESGYLSITGRLKEMIIRGGENIYPAEIEAFYHTHPKVMNVAVFGVPDEKMGEEVGAWMKLHDGDTADPEELRQFAKGKIAHYKVPRFVWIVEEFPMTVTGKIQKFRIQQIVREKLAAAV